MKGECYSKKFDPALPQCPNTEVYHRPLKLGNFTDTWTWCEEHHNTLDKIVEFLTPEVTCGD